MAEKLKLGVVGTGGIWNGAHADVWLKHSEVELVAACDIVEEKAQRFVKEKTPSAKVFTDYKQFLGSGNLDIVDVCTTNILHSEVSVAALNAGKNVLCEKPDAINPVEAQKMADAARASGKLLMAIRNNRFHPATRYLRKAVDAGQFGELYTGRCGWIRRRGMPGAGGWFTNKKLSGGGPLIDLGVHMIDLATWFLGNPRPVSVVGATYAKFADSGEQTDSVHSQFGEKQKGGLIDTEDLATGFIRFHNDASLQIEFSWASNIESEVHFVELRGTKGGFSLQGTGNLKIFTEANGELVDLAPRFNSQNWNDGHKNQIHHFVDCVRGRAKPIVTPEDGVHMIKILSAIYQSAETKSEVKL